MSRIVTIDDVRAAARLLEGVTIRTPVQPIRVVSEMAGTHVMLKLENLQRAGSFKVRGAYNRMSRLTPQERQVGVLAASAGNHAQGVAYAARRLGIDAIVYMPKDAALPKIAATQDYGAEVRLVGETVDEAMIAARAEVEATGKVLIHPYDHVDVVAGQGTVALEILEQVSDVGTIVLPLGGGGLVAGVATVLAQVWPQVHVIGVQSENAASFPDSLAAGRPVPRRVGATIADGIAVGTPGDVTFEILDRLGVEVRTVSDEQISQALLVMLERAKLVVEPAGAAAVAAVMADAKGMPGTIVPVITGGNIDPLLLMRVIQHGMVSSQRYLRLQVRLVDRPGALAVLAETLAGVQANIKDMEHSHTDTSLGMFEALVTLDIEAKGPAHCDEIMAALTAAGFTPTRSKPR
ncbi:MAG: threonine ammonia-lyase [Promicromonosporaceae bacterium]|nr:threonine ammonia-lyase [Promicromonosporaceae bacterium]